MRKRLLFFFFFAKRRLPKIMESFLLAKSTPRELSKRVNLFLSFGVTLVNFFPLLTCNQYLTRVKLVRKLGKHFHLVPSMAPVCPGSCFFHTCGNKFSNFINSFFIFAIFLMLWIGVRWPLNYPTCVCFRRSL